MPESRLQRSIHVAYEARGAYAVNQWGTALSGSGVPDDIYCYRGRFIGLEAKIQSKNLSKVPTTADDRFATKAQQMHLRRIRSAGGIAYAINTLAAALIILTIIDHEVDDDA